ncbi:MAG: DNA protecting protein DprA [Deltaproteobacteria bacterium GWC2_42_11]|nr:MAG: DNA protecting protein DprA [Deltaproteobacteria bacterium GWC2_42_11]
MRFWIGLNHIDGISRRVYKSLIQRFGSAGAVFSASVEELSTVEGFKKGAILAIKRFNEWRDVEEEIRLIEHHKISVITIRDNNFPQNLLAIDDPPPYLYAKGSIFKEDNTAVAVVGTRNPSYYGVRMAEDIAMGLAYAGVNVVSGLARGIDSAAHRGALRGKGRTIAVLGCGIDIVYPPENKKLFEEITLNGAVVSEFPIGTPPAPQNFPMRNRIISGMSLGVLVVEASMGSGSLITANLALEYGRDVFALPGAITSEKSKGTNKLIKEGAKLVESVDDILAELPVTGNISINRGKAEVINLSPEERNILELLEGEPLFIDTIIHETRLQPARVNSILLDMEIKGLIGQQPGKVFYKK